MSPWGSFNDVAHPHKIKKNNNQNRVYFFLSSEALSTYSSSCIKTTTLLNHCAVLSALPSCQYISIHVSSATISPPTLHPLMYTVFILSPVLLWNIRFAFLSLLPAASSCCPQVPYNEEEIRRALIAVHNFAVPQIKVPSSFILQVTLSCLALSYAIVSVSAAKTVVSTWHYPQPSLHSIIVLTNNKKINLQERELPWCP